MEDGIRVEPLITPHWRLSVANSSCEQLRYNSAKLSVIIQNSSNLSSSTTSQSEGAGQSHSQKDDTIVSKPPFTFPNHSLIISNFRLSPALACSHIAASEHFACYSGNRPSDRRSTDRGVRVTFFSITPMLLRIKEGGNNVAWRGLFHMHSPCGREGWIRSRSDH